MGFGDIPLYFPLMGNAYNFLCVSQQNTTQIGPTSKTVRRHLKQVEVARSTIGVYLEDEVNEGSA